MQPPPSLWQRLSPARNLAVRFALLSLVASALLTGLMVLVAGARMQRTLEEGARQELQAYATVAAERFDQIKVREFQAVQQTAARLGFLASAPMEERQDLLEALTEGGSYAWAGFASPAGILSVVTGRVLEGADVSRENWFLQGSSNPSRGLPMEQPWLATALGTKSRFVTFGMPVRDPTGNFLGVLGVHQFWGFPATAMPFNRSRPGMDISIYQRPPNKTWMSSSRGVTGFRYALTPNLEGRSFGSGRDNLNGLDAVYGFDFNDDQGWPLLIVVRQTTESLFAPVRTSQWHLLQWGLAASALLALLAFLAGRRLERKLRAMTRAARLVGAGDPFSLMPEFRTPDQFATTADAINRMIESLKRGRPDDSRGT